jgi:hypothetical protein
MALHLLHASSRGLVSQASELPSPAVQALQVRVRSAVDAIAPPPGRPPMDAAQWNEACARLSDARASFGRLISDPQTQPSPADARAMHELRGLLRAVHDCLPAFEHLARTGQPLKPADLLDDIGLEHHQLVPIAGHPQAPADAVAMLNLCGVSEPMRSETRGLHWAERLFVLANAQSRLGEPALDRAMAGMRAAHDHGIDLLPPVAAGSAVRRGMSVDASLLHVMAERYQSAARSGEVVPQRGLFTGSQAHRDGSGAYPGNVQLRVTAADGSSLKDSSAFNFVPEQREAKARSLSVVVQGAQLLPPGHPLPDAFAIDAHASASSGRSQREFAGDPVLVVDLKEVARSH